MEINAYSGPQSRRITPQSTPIPGNPMAKNSAGGYSFKVDRWDMLDRFLILGTEGGTYYVAEKKLTRDACGILEARIAEDGLRTVARIVEISISGRAFKQDAIIFAHALAAKTGDLETRRAAYDSMPRVCRIGTHLFSWMACIKELGGVSSGVRRAISNWYLGKDPDKLAYQLCKYRQRGGWTHRDVLRQGHVAPNPLLGWAAGKVAGAKYIESPDSARIITGFWAAQEAETTESDSAALIQEYSLTREMVKPEHLNSPVVWEALLEKMPFTAMVRNLGKMSAIGLLKPLSTVEATVAARLVDEERVVRSRIHPVAVLNALRTYTNGRGFKGSLSWSPSARVVDALEKTFEMSFASVTPTGKRFYLGLDVSGSMAVGGCAGCAALSPREGSVAVAMVTARSGDPYVIRGFSDADGHSWVRSNTKMVDLGVTAADSLRSATRKVSNLPFGGTDCSLPMLDALENGYEVDCFVIYTDSETWAGNIQPVQALEKYRRETGINAKLVVVGMVGNHFTIADPSDPGMLDVVGFDAAGPRLVAEFAKS